MNKDAVDALIKNLVGPLSLIRDLHVKVSALEESIREQQPELYKLYLQKQSEIGQNPRVSFNLLGIENLRKLLSEA